MKIETNSNTSMAGLQDNLQRASQSDAKGAGGAVQQSQTGASPAKNSTVSLSSLSSDLRASNGSDIDTAKVESIKSAIRDGSLKMDTSKIADGILSTARDLLQTRTPPTGG
nr:flagellar biosynthesis anti-sigma factor FlgM [Caballeronia sp. J97]